MTKLPGIRTIQRENYLLFGLCPLDSEAMIEFSASRTTQRRQPFAASAAKGMCSSNTGIALAEIKLLETTKLPNDFERHQGPSSKYLFGWCNGTNDLGFPSNSTDALKTTDICDCAE